MNVKHSKKELLEYRRNRRKGFSPISRTVISAFIERTEYNFSKRKQNPELKGDQS